MKSMTVGVVLSHPFHVGLGTDFRLLNQVYPLTKFGIKLKVISQFGPGPTRETDGVQYHCLNGFPSLYEEAYRVSRYLLNQPVLARQTLRSSHYLDWSIGSFAKKLERFLSRENIDVLLAVHQLAAGACSRIRPNLRPPVIADIHGIWAEEMVDSGYLAPGSKQADVAFKFEEKCLRGVDMILVVSNELGYRLSMKYSIASQRFVVIDPCIAPRVAEPKRSQMRSKVVCPATSTHREGLELLLRGMAIVQRDFPQSQLFLTRKGDTLSKMQRLAKELRVHPEYFYFPDISRFYAFLQNCDIGVVTSSRDMTRLVSYPAKLYDYLAVGLPIVANDIGGWSRIIRDAEAGILTDSTPEALAGGISTLMRDPARAFELGNNGLEYLRSKLRPQERLETLLKVL